MIYLMAGVRIFLAAVFGTAGVSKLADRTGFERSLREFGVTGRLANGLAIGLPAAELAVAAALIPESTAVWAALSGLVLLLSFTLAILYNLVRGRTPDCRCFGQLHPTPVGWRSVVRNGLLVTLAGLVVAHGSGQLDVKFGWPSLPVGWIIGGISGLVVVALVVAFSWICVQLLHQQRRLLLRVEALETLLAIDDTASSAPTAADGTRDLDQYQAGGFPTAAELNVGEPAPSFRLASVDGQAVALEELVGRGLPVLLAFTDPNCGPCNALMPDLARVEVEHAGRLTVAIISRGTGAADRKTVADHGFSQILLEQDQEISTVYKVPGTPSAVLISPRGTIAMPLAAGANQIRNLVASAVGTTSRPG